MIYIHSMTTYDYMIYIYIRSVLCNVGAYMELANARARWLYGEEKPWDKKKAIIAARAK